MSSSSLIWYRLSGVVTSLDDVQTEESMRLRVARMVRVEPEIFEAFVLERQNLDCRAGRHPAYVWTVRFTCHKSVRLRAKGLTVVPAEDVVPYVVPSLGGNTQKAAPVNSSSPASRPVVVGMGPAGLFAAWALAKAGMPPIVLERGKPVRERARDVAGFWNKGLLNPESNVLFGEGGAGLYSDGKLTSRSKDRARERHVREALVAWGAEPSILYDAAAHLGTDMMHRLLERARAELLQLGCEIRHTTPLRDLSISDGVLRGLQIGDAGEELACDACILAPGHSARDTYQMLLTRGVTMEAKPFAVGVRIEQPQVMVNRGQYGSFFRHLRLGPASYRLTNKGMGGLRDCYTFCMCPGGRVVACASSAGGVCSNGMSDAARRAPNGNAAFVVPVGGADFAEASPLAGVMLQESIEAVAFQMGGSDYALPATTVEAMLSGREVTHLPDAGSAPRPRVTPADPLACFPEAIQNSLHAGITRLTHRFPQLFTPESLVFGVETRTSSPVRIVRDDAFQSISLRGLFPCGEGAGYAGGIVSSAIDGLRAAEAVLAHCCS